MSDLKEQVLRIFNLFVFAKDRQGKYLYCNENTARVAGLDSPEQINGKTDEELFWCEHADYYHQVDNLIARGDPYLNVLEIQTQPNKIADILVTKSKLIDNDGNFIGIAGSYIDVTGHYLAKKIGNFDVSTKRFYLGEDFDNEYFTKREFQVFRHILLGYSAARSARCLDISVKTVESHVEKIKLKMQCSSKGDVINLSVRFGLTHVLKYVGF